MATRGGARMLVAIAVQESRAQYRIQLGTQGQWARGFWQFERGNRTLKGGCWGVCNHAQLRPNLDRVLDRLGIVTTMDVDAGTALHDLVHERIAWNDILAASVARLLLWSLPRALPGVADEGEGWAQYRAAWNPGKPRPDEWPKAWAIARKVYPDGPAADLEPVTQGVWA